MDEFLQMATESYVFNTSDIGFRIDKWGTGKDQSNLLLITGHSGSGKSTLADQLGEKYHAYVVKLDWFDFYVAYPRAKESPEYHMWKIYTDCVRHANKSGMDPRDLNYESRRKIFNESFVEFMKKCKPNELYIAEGVHIINLMNRVTPSRLPLICKGTSAAVSAMRRMSRDGHIADTKNPNKDIGRIKAIIEWMGIEKTNRKFMADMNATGTAVPVKL